MRVHGAVQFRFPLLASMHAGFVCTVPCTACASPEDASCKEVQADAHEYLEESSGHGSGLMKGLAKLGTAGAPHPNHVERDLFRQLRSLGLKLPLVRISDPTCQLPRSHVVGRCIWPCPLSLPYQLRRLCQLTWSCRLRRSSRPRRPCRLRRSCRPHRSCWPCWPCVQLWLLRGHHCAIACVLFLFSICLLEIAFFPTPDLQLRNHTG